MWSKGGTDMLRTGKMGYGKIYNELHWDSCGFLPAIHRRVAALEVYRL